MPHIVSMNKLVYNIEPASPKMIVALDLHCRKRVTDGSSNIDPERTHLNAILVGVQPDEKTGEKGGLLASLEAFYAGGVGRPAKQSESPYLRIVISASPGYFRPEDPAAEGTWEKAGLTAWQTAVMAQLQAEHGEDLVFAELHLDEDTPHIHAVVAPTYMKTPRRPGRRKRNETEDEFAARKAAAEAAIGLRTVGRASHEALSRRDSFRTLRQNMTLALDHLGIEYGDDLEPDAPKGKTTRQWVKEQAAALRRKEAELAARIQALDVREADLEGREQALQEREAALENEGFDLLQQAMRQEQSRENLEIQSARQTQTQVGLDAMESRLERRSEVLDARQTDLEARDAAVLACDADLALQAGALEVREAEITRRHRQASEALVRAEAYETERRDAARNAEAQVAKLEGEQQALQQRKAALDRRQDEVTTIAAEAADLAVEAVTAVVKGKLKKGPDGRWTGPGVARFHRLGSAITPALERVKTVMDDLTKARSVLRTCLDDVVRFLKHPRLNEEMREMGSKILKGQGQKVPRPVERMRDRPLPRSILQKAASEAKPETLDGMDDGPGG